MQIRSVMTSYCLQLKMVKRRINNISRNIKAVLLKCRSLQKQNGALNAVAIATLSAPVPSLTLSTLYPAQTWPREFKMTTSPSPSLDFCARPLVPGSARLKNPRWRSISERNGFSAMEPPVTACKQANPLLPSPPISYGSG